MPWPCLRMIILLFHTPSLALCPSVYRVNRREPSEELLEKVLLVVDGLGLVAGHDSLSEEMGGNGALEVGRGCRLMWVRVGCKLS